MLARGDFVYFMHPYSLELIVLRVKSCGPKCCILESYWGDSYRHTLSSLKSIRIYESIQELIASLPRYTRKLPAVRCIDWERLAARERLKFHERR